MQKLISVILLLVIVPTEYGGLGVKLKKGPPIRKNPPQLVKKR